MNKKRMLRLVLLAWTSIALSVSGGSAAAWEKTNNAAIPGSWNKIDVAPGTYKATDGNGNERDITPSCSGGPVCKIDPVTKLAAIDPVTGKPQCREGNKQFSFFYKPGKSDKVVVYFDGGGACWDSNTCVEGNATALGAYVPEIGPGSDPAGKGGLFNLANEENPYREWSMVVVPYCTGDIHWGSNDQTYVDIYGLVTGQPGTTVNISHRGFDNFLFVRKWMKNKFGEMDGKLLVTGSSAGAYGASFAFPHLKKSFPRAKGYLMSDGGSGVITDGFLDQAIDGMNPVWNIQPNLAHWIPGMDSLPSAPADRFLSTYYFALGGYYPKDRFSQYTTQWDMVQALFYNIMRNQNNLFAWNPFGLEFAESYAAWVPQAQNNTFVTSALPNYRYFVAEGCNHTLLRFDDDYYGSHANHPIQFLDWFKALTRERDDAGAWQNTWCMNCTLPPTVPEMSACLVRSVGG